MDSHVLRPMMRWCPIVIDLKRLSSFGRCQGIAPLAPITPLRAIATMIEIRGTTSLDGDGSADSGMRIVALEREVLVTEVEQALHRGVEPHGRQGTRLARELLARLLEVIPVKM